MVKKKSRKKTSSRKKKESLKKDLKEKTIKKAKKKVKTSSSKVDLRNDEELAMDFAVKIYKKFGEIVKAIILFGSTTEKKAKSSSDIDLIIVIDDASVVWDQELIAWYREELARISQSGHYKKEFHVTTVKLTTWWSDLTKGDPTLMNVIRYGKALIDIGGFFHPLKALLSQGRISATPEAVYMALQRAPEHFQRSRVAALAAIEGLFWAMVDSSQAALMAANLVPPSPQHIYVNMKKSFVEKNMLKDKYIEWYKDLFILHKMINHGEITELKGGELAEWQDRTEEYIDVMAKLVNQLIKARYGDK